jgi:hypothetical protein
LDESKHEIGALSLAMSEIGDDLSEVGKIAGGFRRRSVWSRMTTPQTLRSTFEPHTLAAPPGAIASRRLDSVDPSAALS